MYYSLDYLVIILCLSFPFPSRLFPSPHPFPIFSFSSLSLPSFLHPLRSKTHKLQLRVWVSAVSFLSEVEFSVL